LLAQRSGAINCESGTLGDCCCWESHLFCFSYAATVAMSALLSYD
jgi:hypothetical protein